MGRNKKIAWLMAVTLIATVAAALASVPQRGRGGRGMRGHGGGPMVLLRELDLSEEQRESIHSVLEQARETGTMKRLMASKQALEEAVESGADEGAVRELAYQVGLVEGDAAVERIQLRDQIRSLLTAEQLRELDELRAERKQEREERRQRFEERMERRGRREPPEL